MNMFLTGHARGDKAVSSLSSAQVQKTLYAWFWRALFTTSLGPKSQKKGTQKKTYNAIIALSIRPISET